MTDSTGHSYAIVPGGVGFQEPLSSSYPWCYRSTVITPYWLPVGSYTFTVFLDAGNTVPECDDNNNNRASKSFTVVPP